MFLVKLCGNWWRKKRHGENPVLNGPVVLAVLVQVAIDGTIGTRQLVGVTSVGRTSI